MEPPTSHPRRTSLTALAALLCLSACSARIPDETARTDPAASSADRSEESPPLRSPRHTDRPSLDSGEDDAPAPRGTERWRMTRPATNGQIEGYVDRPGAPPGTVVGVRVSTGDPSFHVDVYRIGAYHGGSGHLVWRSRSLPGRRQAPPHFSHPDTRTVVAGWRDSVRVDTTGWEPGAYLFRFTGSSGWQAAAPYVVTSPSVVGRVVLVAPVTTWQAYNRWGGYSLYFGPEGDRRAWRVSFDRPYHTAGSGKFQFTLAPVA